jgi:hypothetical protein
MKIKKWRKKTVKNIKQLLFKIFGFSVGSSSLPIVTNIPPMPKVEPPKIHSTEYPKQFLKSIASMNWSKKQLAKDCCDLSNPYKYQLARLVIEARSHLVHIGEWHE